MLFVRNPDKNQNITARHLHVDGWRKETRMSLHKSLKVGGQIRKKRNVMKRFERIDALKEDGRLKDGDKVWGLPKTKVVE